MKKRFFSLFLVFVMMLIIFSFSNQQGSQSESISLGIVDSLIDIETSDTTLVYYLHLGLRKCAHMLSYCILTWLTYYHLTSYQLHSKKRFLLTFLIPFIYACSDEFHQTFIPNRLGSISDVGIDSIGILVAIACIFLIKKRLIQSQNNVKSI